MSLTKKENSGFLSKKERLKYLKYLNKYKGLVGFGDWSVKMGIEYKEASHIAEVFTDYLEKELEVQLYTLFKDLNDEKQKNVLFHELVHARIHYFNKLKDKTTEFFEEDLVNDLVRGFEAHHKFDYDESKKTNAKKGTKRP